MGSILGAPTLVRKWVLDVNDEAGGGTYAVPDWVRLYGHSEFQPAFEPSMQDDSDCDTDTGAKSQIASAYSWSIVTKVLRKVLSSDPTQYDPGQEILRAIGQAQIGLSNVADIRFYEMNTDGAGEIVGPAGEAWRGFAAVQWSPDGGNMEALDMVSVTLYGRGDCDPIEHPYAGAGS